MRPCLIPLQHAVLAFRLLHILSTRIHGGLKHLLSMRMSACSSARALDEASLLSCHLIRAYALQACIMCLHAWSMLRAPTGHQQGTAVGNPAMSVEKKCGVMPKEGRASSSPKLVDTNSRPCRWKLNSTLPESAILQPALVTAVRTCMRMLQGWLLAQQDDKDWCLGAKQHISLCKGIRCLVSAIGGAQ